jgi:transcriptional regulator with XRE-family HTH domain
MAQLFGAVLKRLRGDMGAEEVASLVGLSASAYRLIESGGAVLLPVHSAGLLRAFHKLNWNRVVQYLVSAQALGLDSDTKESASYLKELADVDPELTAFIAALGPVVDIGSRGDPKKVDHAIEQHGLVTHALNFLCGHSRSAGGKQLGSFNEWARIAPSSIPPIQLDALVNQARTLSAFPHSVPPAKLKQWEEDQSDRFQRLYALVRDIELLTAAIQNYSWDFLWKERFDGAFIAILDGEPLERARSEFIRGLADQKLARFRELHRRQPSRKHPEKQIEELRNDLEWKIRIASVKPIAKQFEDFSMLDPALGQLVPYRKGANYFDVRNIWFYHFHDTEVTVGFADNYKHDGEPFVAVTLNTDQTREMLRRLETFWKGRDSKFVPISRT